MEVTGETEEALKYYDKAIEADERNVGAWNARGDLLSELWEKRRSHKIL